MVAAYDVSRRETFESIEDIWMREVDMYSTVDNAVKMVVANKVDKVLYPCLACVTCGCKLSTKAESVRCSISCRASFRVIQELLPHSRLPGGH